MSLVHDHPVHKELHKINKNNVHKAVHKINKGPDKVREFWRTALSFPGLQAKERRTRPCVFKSIEPREHFFIPRCGICHTRGGGGGLGVCGPTSGLNFH